MRDDIKQLAGKVLEAFATYDRLPKSRRAIETSFALSGSLCSLATEYEPTGTWTFVRITVTAIADPGKCLASGTIMAAGAIIAVVAFDCDDGMAERMLATVGSAVADNMIDVANFIKSSMLKDFLRVMGAYSTTPA